ncbi:MAG: hypothetical protein FDZ75_07995 [Actinobacteria bacterium]|nr:MAG: hypothetical protein FDZ75_07995 [Actinomycetota bacterium]
MAVVARSLGADVPFFLVGGTALFGGRGDDLVHRLPHLDVEVAIVKPAAPVPTVEAYRTFDADPQLPAGPEAVAAALISRDLEPLGPALANNMEKAAGLVVPETADALRWIREQPGVLGAALAGSGSAVFAITSDAASARTVAEKGAASGWWSVATRFRSTGVDVTEGQGSQ